MSRYYRRRYYSRRKNSSSGGIIGIAIILAVVAYSYGAALNRALTYAVITGLAVLGLIVIQKIVVKLWRWWSARRRRTRISYSTLDLETEVDTMTGLEFERYVAALLKRQGYTNIKMTERYDWGVDIIARKDGITWGVQVKRSSDMVKAAAVRQVVTALSHYNCDRAMVVSNGIYSRPARELAKSNDCLLIDRDTLELLQSSI